MTAKQMHNYNRMLFTLQKIAKGYETPSQLQKNAGKQYGLEYQEVLEMTYENIQLEAKTAVKGIKKV